MLILAKFMNGFTQGSIYALIAIGFVIIFGTMNLVTFAHGEVYMVGAFMGFLSLSLWHLPWYLALAMGMGMAGFSRFPDRKDCVPPAAGGLCICAPCSSPSGSRSS